VQKRHFQNRDGVAKQRICGAGIPQVGELGVSADIGSQG
jgi:hypothetical protein